MGFSDSDCVSASAAEVLWAGEADMVEELLCFVVLVVFWRMVANWHVYFYAEQQNQYLNTVLLEV